jgi:hypothetical protein
MISSLLIFMRCILVWPLLGLSISMCFYLTKNIMLGRGWPLDEILPCGTATVGPGSGGYHMLCACSVEARRVTCDISL